jgi:hypothetical protein
MSEESAKLTADIQQEVLKLDSLILKIDSLLNSEEPISESDIGEVSASLDDLEARKKELTEQQ